MNENQNNHGGEYTEDNVLEYAKGQQAEKNRLRFQSTVVDDTTPGKKSRKGIKSSQAASGGACCDSGCLIF
jgi:hypothetical protein